MIYEWWLDWMGKRSVYVGQCRDFRRTRINHYRCLVRRLLKGLPYYRCDLQRDYQPIIYALADATRKGQRIELRFVANVSKDWLRKAAEAMRIELRRCQGWAVLNVGDNIAEKFERLKLEKSQQAITLP